MGGSVARRRLTGGAGPEVGEDLVDHRRLRDGSEARRARNLLERPLRRPASGRWREHLKKGRPTFLVAVCLIVAWQASAYLLHVSFAEFLGTAFVLGLIAVSLLLLHERLRPKGDLRTELSRLSEAERLEVFKSLGYTPEQAASLDDAAKKMLGIGDSS